MGVCQHRLWRGVWLVFQVKGKAAKDQTQEGSGETAACNRGVAISMLTFELCTPPQIPMKRRNSHVIPESGVYMCPAAGTCKYCSTPLTVLTVITSSSRYGFFCDSPFSPSPFPPLFLLSLPPPFLLPLLQMCSNLTTRTAGHVPRRCSIQWRCSPRTQNSPSLPPPTLTPPTPATQKMNSLTVRQIPWTSQFYKLVWPVVLRWQRWSLREPLGLVSPSSGHPFPPQSDGVMLSLWL